MGTDPTAYTQKISYQEAIKNQDQVDKKLEQI